jgi:hypothetical protein
LMAEEGSLMKWKVSFAGGAFVWVSVAMTFCFDQVGRLKMASDCTVRCEGKAVLREL